MDSFDLIVVGGGISGLSLAHAASRAGGKGYTVCVLERESRVGGALHSEPVGDGFWFELGAHTAYNSYGRFMGLMEDTGLAGGRTERGKASWKLWENGRAVSVPSRLNWLQLLPRLPRLLTTRRAGHTVEAYFSRVLGPDNYRRVVGPMLGAVVSQNAGGFPADLLFKKRPRRKDWPRSFTLAGGLGGLPRALAAGGDFEVRTGPDVTAQSLRREGAGWRLTTTGGQVLESRTLALATPPDTAGGLLQDAVPEVAEVLAGFRVNGIATVGVAVPVEKVVLPSMAGLVGLEVPFRSVVTRDPVPHESLRGFAFHFRPETLEQTQNEQIEAVLGCPPVDWAHRVAVRRRLPSLAEGHAQRIARLDALLAGEPLLLTGNWFGGMAIEDCLARSAEEAVRLKG